MMYSTADKRKLSLYKSPQALHKCRNIRGLSGLVDQPSPVLDLESVEQSFQRIQVHIHEWNCIFYVG